ncbi:MAG: transposase [Verrucomicrobiota bacterium]
MLPKLPVTADTKGRVRTSKAQRRAILAQFENSGMSAAEFARRTGLKYSTFALWVQRYRRTKRSERKSPVRLLEAVVAPTPLSPGLLVQLPAGARLEIREAGQVPLVAALLRALEQSC